ncbi:spore germination protein GerPC [Marinicrinis sediminis]|uniref:Spore germination protein GerPC n=1 Tax=Marinicrinis sediminis TaxID=1652465 RepID=A0ABW5REH4_9BACL
MKEEFHVYALLEQTLRYMMWQAEKLHQLQHSVTTLEERLKQTQDPPNQTSIERIEYHFDQLKIETLEGTLNIGLTPSGGSRIEDFMVQNQQPPKPGPPQSESEQNAQEFEELQESEPVYLEVKEDIQRFLDGDVYQRIVEFEDLYENPLTHEQRMVIIEDVRKQIPQRIRHYLQHPDVTSQSLQPRIRADIINGIEQFMKKQKPLTQKNDPQS